MKSGIKANKGFEDYKRSILQRLYVVVEKSVEILLEEWDKWQDEIDAYWLLRAKEDVLDYPVTYDIVEEAVERARKIMKFRITVKEVAST